MNIFPFLKVNDNYCVLITDEIKECTKVKSSFFLPISSIDFLKNGEKLNSELVNELLKDLHIQVEHDYFVFKNDYSIVLYRKPNILEALTIKRNTDKYFSGLQKIDSFKNNNKSYLLLNLFDEKKNNIGHYLKILMSFCLCNEFSFWLYNGITQTMTLEASSLTSKQLFRTRSDDTSLFEFIDKKIEYESRIPNKIYTNGSVLDHMKTLNRVLIPLESNEHYGILNFYSEFENFDLKSDTIKFLRAYIKNRFSIYKEAMHISFENFENELSKSYDLTDYQPILNDVVKRISNEFKFETCSVLLKKDSSLHLISSHNYIYSGKPKNPVVYSLNSSGLSLETIRTNKTTYSYDLKNDERNSHFYDEPKELESSNWIGIPLVWDNEPKGLLRVSNKYFINENDGAKKVRSLQYEDFIFLQVACRSISNILRIVELLQINELKISELKRNTEELESFSRVFLHEIRTPISKFSLSPIYLTKYLEKGKEQGKVDNEIFEHVRKRLNDITVLGDRLAFVTNVYYYDQIVKPVNIEKINVLSELVFPVVNITKDYVRTKWGVNINHEYNSLIGQVVFGDKRLLNIVLNILIDNAAKYSNEEKKIIRVYGKRDYSNNLFRVFVENHGYPIYDDEVDDIFRDRKRGRYVVENRLEGTGIGLDLAKRIMLNSNGDLRLISNKNPITFEMSIPTF